MSAAGVQLRPIVAPAGLSAAGATIAGGPTASFRLVSMTTAADRLSTMASSVLGGELPIRIKAWDGSISGAADGPVLVINNRRALRRLV